MLISFISYHAANATTLSMYGYHHNYNLPIKVFLNSEKRVFTHLPIKNMGLAQQNIKIKQQITEKRNTEKNNSIL